MRHEKTARIRTRLHKARIFKVLEKQAIYTSIDLRNYSPLVLPIPGIIPLLSLSVCLFPVKLIRHAMCESRDY